MIPKNSPRAFYTALCSECGETMRPVLKRQANGVLIAIQFACDKCKYQVEASLPYINSTPAKYEPLPEPVPEVRPALVPSPEQLEKMKASISEPVATQPIQVVGEPEAPTAPLPAV